MSFLNLFTDFKEHIRTKVVAMLKPESGLDSIDACRYKFETPPDEKMGHLAFAGFPLAKILKKAPPAVAAELAEKWGPSPYFKRIEAKGPYLNFFLDPGYLAQALMDRCVKSEQYGNNDQGKNQTLMVEFSSPNTNKPLHLGHARNNLIGSVLSEILKCNGYRLVKANLVNDRGVHICKSMLAYRKWGQGETPESTGEKGDKLVGKYYVLYDKKEKEDPSLIEEVRQMLRHWETGDRETIDLWKLLNGWVLDGFKETYRRMNVAFDKYYFESQTYKGGRQLVLAALEKGICQREENGAVSIDLETETLGRKILLRGDGTSMYITQDINTTVTKFADFDLDGSFFVVGNEQDNHFQALFKILSKFGYQWADRCEHISYGMINLPEGKMKSRQGTVVDLDDLMDEMKALALEEIKARNEDDAAAEETREPVAEAIGQAAINFFILRTNSVRDMTFNPRESLSFDGATGPYLQYTHARICSLHRNAETDYDQLSFGEYDWNSDETRLLVALARYPDTIFSAARDRNPAIVCSYIYDLCRSFNKFYYEHPILRAGDESTVQARLALTHAIRGVLRKTLRILGITPLVKM